MINNCPKCGSDDVVVNKDNHFSEFYGHEHQDSSVTCNSCGFEIVVDSDSNEYPCSCCHDLTSVAVREWNSNGRYTK